MIYQTHGAEDRHKEVTLLGEEERESKIAELSEKERELMRLFDGFSISFEDDGATKGFRIRFDLDTKKLYLSSYGFGFFEDGEPYREVLYREMRERARGTCVADFSYWYWNIVNE